MTLALFKQDRARAYAAQDANAGLCTLATVDANNQPQARTLVLRDVGDQLALFINATSPKWRELQHSRRAAVTTWWAAIQVQYRLSCTLQPVPEQVVRDSWQLRPAVPKRMDWLYSAIAEQSTEIGTRARLQDELANLTLARPLHAPDSARGLLLLADRIERLDLSMQDGIHDRRLYQLSDQGWQETVLVP